MKDLRNNSILNEDVSVGDAVSIHHFSILDEKPILRALQHTPKRVR